MNMSNLCICRPTVSCPMVKSNVIHCFSKPNPWTNINWDNTIADCDKDVMTPSFCQLNGIDTLDLPEPYTGSLDSPVVFLNLNPGLNPCTMCFYGHSDYLELRRKTLLHTADKFMWFEDVKGKCGGVHGGCKWWKQRTKTLAKKVLNYTAKSKLDDSIDNIPFEKMKFFVLEFFPYHSKHSFNFPKLPSDAYRNYLLCQAMQQGKLIVIMRGKKMWEEVLKQLNPSYNNIIELKKNRSPYLTPKLFDNSADWDQLVNTLKKNFITFKQ